MPIFSLTFLFQAPSHDQRGKCNIEIELFSSQNDRFVLHDSEGFEPGEVEKYATVKKFVQHRREQHDLKDQLHAVWFVSSEQGSIVYRSDAQMTGCVSRYLMLEDACWRLP
jgi:hypothetical protein